MDEGRILVVDDNPIVLDVIRVALEAEGFLVETEESVFRMSEAIRRHQPELILLDVKMPALSGPRAAEILKNHRFSQNIPVLFFSDMDVPELERLALEAGVAGFVSKAMEKEHLVAEIRAWVGRPTAGSSPSVETGATPAATDRAINQQQIQVLVDAGGDLLARMVAAFEKQLAPRLESLRLAVEKKDSAAVAEDAHFLKGSSRALGAAPLVDLLDDIELKAGEGSVPRLVEVDRVVAETERVVRVLKELLAKQPTPVA